MKPKAETRTTVNWKNLRKDALQLGLYTGGLSALTFGAIKGAELLLPNSTLPFTDLHRIGIAVLGGLVYGGIAWAETGTYYPILQKQKKLAK